jgi:transposase
VSRDPFGGVRPRSLDEALAIIERLLATIAAQQERITALEARIVEQRVEITALRAQVAALTERLEQTSQNSSRPPSTDPPRVERPRRPASGRRPGAQPGHAAQARGLVPEGEVDAVVPVKPRQCRRCGARLRGSDPTPRRHQVTEVPPVRPTITEYQLHTLACAQCGVATAPSWPVGVPRGVLGPRLVAMVAVCAGVYHLSKRTTAGLLADLFHVQVAVGTVAACEQTASAALAAPVAAAQAYVQQAPVVHADETGWRERRQRAWLWVAVTTRVTVFLIHRRRGAVAARVLLGQSTAVLISDRWSAYARWPLGRRQLCWAHLRREFVAFTEREDAAARLGRAFLRDTTQMFAGWHRVRDGTWTRAQFQTAMQPLRRRVERRLRRGAVGGHTKTAATCRDLVALAPALWTFVDVPGVEPTNNAAERALRPAVLWRKGCWGTHSAAGSRFVERILTVAASLKQQRRNIVDYVTQACVAALHGEAPPSLLPDAAHSPQFEPAAA